jgi:hypothetical protein
MMKNSLRNTVLLLGFAFFSTTLLASDGWLAYDSQVKAVNTNGNNNGTTVGVVVEGGSGPCNNAGKSGNLRGWIGFQEQNGISKSALNRLYAMALTAQTTGKKVRIYSYSNYPDCNSAITMEMHD